MRQSRYDDLIQGATALPALMAQTSEDGVPRYVPNALVDRIVGLTAVGAICASLVHRDRTGQGQRVDIPMFETMASFVMGDHMGGLTYDPPLDKGGYAAISRATGGLTRPPTAISASSSITTSSGRISSPPPAATICAPPEFATFAGRAGNIDHVYAELARILETKTTAEWMAILTHADVPVMPMHDLETLLTDPHMVATDRFPVVDHPTEGKIRQHESIGELVGNAGRDRAAGAAARRAQRGSAAEAGIPATRSRRWCATRYQDCGEQIGSQVDSRSPPTRNRSAMPWGKICSRFDDAYWLKKDKEGGYPADFHMALADAGWLGICIPEEYGGSGSASPMPRS